jgi:hypothetical protein
MPTTVRSPWSREKGEPHPRLAESPGSRSSPSNAARSDGGHLAHNIGKGGSMPAARRDNATPVVGGETAANLERALDGALKR